MVRRRGRASARPVAPGRGYTPSQAGQLLLSAGCPCSWLWTLPAAAHGLSDNRSSSADSGRRLQAGATAGGGGGGGGLAAARTSSAEMLKGRLRTYKILQGAAASGHALGRERGGAQASWGARRCGCAPQCADGMHKSTRARRDDPQAPLWPRLACSLRAPGASCAAGLAARHSCYRAPTRPAAGRKTSIGAKRVGRGSCSGLAGGLKCWMCEGCWQEGGQRAGGAAEAAHWPAAPPRWRRRWRRRAVQVGQAACLVGTKCTEWRVAVRHFVPCAAAPAWWQPTCALLTACTRAAGAQPLCRRLPWAGGGGGGGAPESSLPSAPHTAAQQSNLSQSVPWPHHGVLGAPRTVRAPAGGRRRVLCS